MGYGLFRRHGNTLGGVLQLEGSQVSHRLMRRFCLIARINKDGIFENDRYSGPHVSLVGRKDSSGT